MRLYHDDGVYRHMRFRNKETIEHWFDLVTWPGCLCINGDMGTFTFARVDDMFTFFRGDRSINPTYWSEKVIGTDRHDALTDYRRASFEEAVNEHVEQSIKDLYLDPETPEDQEDPKAQLIRDAVKEHIFEGYFDLNNEQDAYRALFEFPEMKDIGFGFHDSWEWNFREYNYHFIWNCFAVQWGIQKYDTYKAKEDASRTV